MPGELRIGMGLRDRLNHDSAEAIGHVIGMIAVFVGVAGLVLSIALATDFSIQDNALSELGEGDRELAWLFNGTTILAGALAAIFFAILIDRVKNRYQRTGMAIMAIAGVSLAGIGLFPIGHPLHLPVAVIYFVALSLGILMTGYGDRQRDRPLRAMVAFNLVLLHAIAWLFSYLTLEGIALPETVGALIYGIWIILIVIQRGRDLNT